MLPEKWEWKRFSPLDKVTYIAQFLAPVALLVTVIFSYLGWQEARRSLEIQERMFTAQNGPRLQLSQVSVGQLEEGPVLTFTLKNFGQSEARNVCVRILDVRFEPVDGTCGNEQRRTVSVAQDETFPYMLPLTGPRLAAVRFVPDDAHIVDENAHVEGCHQGQDASIVAIYFEYENALGVQQTGGDQVLLCGPAN